jgi:hypothetical protein
MTVRIITDSNGRKHITNEPLLHQPAPVQEPVAWKTDDVELYVREDKFGFYNIPLYTHPAQRQWVGLTDDEWDELADKYSMIIFGGLKQEIEAKLKEKNSLPTG